MAITVGLLRPRLQVATRTAEEELIKLRTKFLRPWHVILHNDNIHWAHDVAKWLVEAVPGLSSQDAWQITEQAHTTGQALVITCPREEAELYQDRLVSFQLTVTIEPAE